MKPNKSKPITKPIKYPVDFETFLRILMPQKKYEDRLPVLKRYLADGIKLQKWHELRMRKNPVECPSWEKMPFSQKEALDKIEEAVKIWRQGGFTKEEVEFFKNDFNNWHKEYYIPRVRAAAARGEEPPPPGQARTRAATAKTPIKKSGPKGKKRKKN